MKSFLKLTAIIVLVLTLNYLLSEARPKPRGVAPVKSVEQTTQRVSVVAPVKKVQQATQRVSVVVPFPSAQEGAVHCK